MAKKKKNKRLFVNSDLHKLAKEVVERELRERELLLAQFMLENPEVPIDQIVLSTKPNDTGGLDFSVREMDDSDVPPAITH